MFQVSDATKLYGGAIMISHALHLRKCMNWGRKLKFVKYSKQNLIEFLHVDDLADACYFLMQNYNEPGLINIGVGEDITIAELAELIKNIVGFTGDIIYDTAKPDGTPRKLMDVSKLNSLGWKASISLTEGITKVYQSHF